MMAHIEDGRLQDYADGTLAGSERSDVEMHLAVCSACRTALDRTAALLAGIGALPRAIDPPRDLLPGITARIDRLVDGTPDQAPLSSVRFGDRSLRSVRVLLAAAAIVLIALSSAVTALVVRGIATPAGAESRAQPSAVRAADLHALETRYIQATSELETVLDRSRGALTPETMRLLAENLRVVDGALAEMRSALDDDPGNSMLSSMLLATYETKLELLRRAAASARI